MSERFFVERPITGSSAELVDAEAQHLSRVMRAAVGDEVVLFDGGGAQVTSEVTRTPKAAVTRGILGGPGGTAGCAGRGIDVLGHAPAPPGRDPAQPGREWRPFLRRCPGR